MGRPDLKPNAKRQRPDHRGPSSASLALAAERALNQARALLECTRAVLCAGDEVELANAVCEVLVGSGVYAEACIAFLEASSDWEDRRSFYAGPQTECADDPDRFWTDPVREQALTRVLDKGAPDLTAAESGTVMLALLVEGRTVAVLAVRTSAQRAFDPGEPRQLQLLANDVAFALAQLQKDAQRRAVSVREKRLRETFEYAGVGINRIDEHGRFIEVNQKFCEMLGYGREELVGRATRDVTVPEDYGAGAAFRERARLGHTTASFSGEKRYIRKDGTHVWVRRTISPAYDEAGGVRDTISVVEDITERKQAEESLQESEQQLRAMFENADVGIAVTGLDMRYLRVNDKYRSIVGYEEDELLRMRVSEVNLDENVERMREDRERMVREELPSTTSEKQLVRKDGSLVWVSLATSLVRASDGSPRYFIAVIQDISESKRAAEALKELAHYDILTKLPNRALFYDRLAHGIAQARRNKWALGVMFIDLDRFKYVNDTFGHTAGDQLLIQISRRLAECVRSDDTVGHLSGDEFAVVLGRLAAPEDAALVAKKIVQALNQPFRLQGAELYVTASIGITLFPNDGTEQDTLIRNADVAMYRAKDLGRNNYQFFTPEMNRRTREMLNMESELRRALERDEFVLHYQPKVSLASGRIVAVEALLRWHHPERGLVSPGDFMPSLEETGLIVQAGDWVLRAVCRQLKDWERAGLACVPVAINLSARQFLAPDLAQTIRQILEEYQVPAELVEIELTESSVMTNTEDAIRTLEYLQSIGLAIAIDDFGTGYSSLSYLKRFPIRALKVDRSFVRDITTDPNDAAITQAIISMAHTLDLKVIAEGVETEAQLAFLAQYGCDEVQGFLFSQAVPGEDCGAMIADDRRMRLLVESVKETTAYRLELSSQSSQVDFAASAMAKAWVPPPTTPE